MAQAGLIAPVTPKHLRRLSTPAAYTPPHGFVMIVGNPWSIVVPELPIQSLLRLEYELPVGVSAIVHRWGVDEYGQSL